MWKDESVHVNVPFACGISPPIVKEPAGMATIVIVLGMNVGVIVAFPVRVTVVAMLVVLPKVALAAGLADQLEKR